VARPARRAALLPSVPQRRRTRTGAPPRLRTRSRGAARAAAVVLLKRQQGREYCRRTCMRNAPAL
jgi:hypothetical protein